MVLGELKAMVSIEIVKAGIMWLLSLLTPTSMFVKACKAIVDIVMFVVTQASQIKEFVDSVLDSIESIARGGAGAVSGLVEKALARALPLVLGLLASLVGLGNIPPKIRATLAKAQDYVGKGIDWVVGHIVKYAKSLLARLKGKKKESNPAELEKRLDKGLSAGVGAVDRFAGRKVAGRLLHPILAVIRVRYRLTRLELVADGDTWAVEGEVNPKGSKKTSAKRPDPKELRDDIVRRLKEPWMRRGPFALGLKIQPEIPHSMGSSDHTTEEERRMFRHELGEFMSGGMKCHQCGTPIAVTDRMSVDHIPPSAILNNIPADILEDAGFYGEAARQTVNHQCRKHQAVQGGMTRVILAKYRMLLQLLAEEKK